MTDTVFELYRFAHGAQRWCYTSARSAIDHQSERYVSAAITRNALEHSDTLQRQRLEMTVPRDLPVAGLFMAAPPEGIVSITLYRREQRDAPVITCWKGRVSACQFEGMQAKLHCAPITSSLKRPGLRAHYQLLCRHVLYSTGCGALKESFRHDGTIAAIAGSRIQVAIAATQPDGAFVGGLCTAREGARMVLAHHGIDLTLTAPLQSLAVGDPVQLYLGCDHSMTHCNARFANLAHFGGFPWIPLKNPFSGDALV